MATVNNPIANRYRTARTSSGVCGVYLSASFRDLLADGAALQPGDILPGNVSLLNQVRERATRGDSWTYGDARTLAGWMRQMNEGDPQGRALVDSLTAAIAPAMLAPLNVKRRVARGASGDEFCIHRARGGNLERAWSFRARAVGKAPAPIVVVVPMTANSGSDAETFRYRAACAVALAGPLMRAGYRVEVISADFTANTFHGGPRYLVAAHRIAGNGTGLDVPRVMAALSSAHLRHATFLAMAAAPWTTNGGLGQACDDGGKIAEFIAAAGLVRPGADVVTIPANIRAEGAARAWLAKVSRDYA